MKTLLAFFFLAFVKLLSAQSVEKGDIIIDPYYGAPNFGKIAAKAFPVVNDKVIDGTGPFGLRAEYMLRDKIGVGIDYIYNAFSISGTIDSINTEIEYFQSFGYKVKIARTRVQARFNYHFVRKEKVDMYVGLGAGINLRKPTVSTDMLSRKEYSGTVALIPVSARFALGFRYYFIRHIGLHAELGVGGPLVSAGLSIKI
jgi:hypothetical protein